MLTAIDGKIIGPYMNTPESNIAGRIFHQIAFGYAPHYRHQGWISGRITTDDNFTDHRKPDVAEDAPPVPEGDFIAKPDAGMFYVSIDPSGKLGWVSNELHYGETTAHIVEVLTERASNVYKDFLRRLKISYLIAGANTLDCAVVMEKLKTLLGMDTVLLGGGGVTNWSFVQAGLCDELSVVVAPAADGSSESPTLFETKHGVTTEQPIRFLLKDVEVMREGCIWLRYEVRNNIDGQSAITQA
ncbi:RibD family protein [Eubacteriales bacterium OttesenSCG-928-A19]|nr:RibD family protein [Eubacteriales bacterium OttesenSCG-928-A19]